MKFRKYGTLAFAVACVGLLASCTHAQKRRPHTTEPRSPWHLLKP